MAYDVELADRIRELVAGQESTTEQAMFGGLAFLIRGHMAVAVSGRGVLMVRVDPHDTARLTAPGVATPMEMNGRPMTGWLTVPPDALRTKRQLARWVRLGVDRASSLPDKPARRRI